MVLDFMKLLATSLGSSARVVLAQLRGVGTEGDDDNAEPFDSSEVVQPMGLVSRPVATSSLEALVLRDGDEAIVIAIVDKGMTALSDLDEGETRLYGAQRPTATLRIRASGAIEITAHSGQDIVLNGGTLRVARESDAVSAGTLYFVPGSGGATLTYSPPGGPPGAGTPIALSGLTITSGAGATNVKA